MIHNCLVYDEVWGVHCHWLQACQYDLIQQI